MSKAAELLEQLNSLDESLVIEAKRGVGHSLLETVCAFSNEPDLGGGIILVGVEKDEYDLFSGYRTVGVDDPDKLTREIATQCAGGTFNIPLRPIIRAEKIDDKCVLVVEVPELSASEKPVFFVKHGLPRGAYRRIGSTDQQCTEDDLIALFDGRNIQTYDDRILSDARIEDIDPLALEHYRKLRKNVNPEAEELKWTDTELLEALSAVKSDSGILKPTLAGMLLFGNRLALRRTLPMARVDYIRVPGNEWVRDPSTRFSTTDMRGSLLQLVQRVQDQVFEELPKAFSLKEGDIQARGESLPARVLREAIVNAVMHASYKVHQPIQIIRYSNRIEIRNPGYSLKNESKLGEPGSRLRNPKLSAVFHETNLAETKGSGIRTMGRLMQEGGFAPPTFESDRKDDSFTLRLLLNHFLTPADLEWLNRLGVGELSESQKRALIFIKQVGAIDNQTYRQINAVDTFVASSDLRGLRDHGLLEMKGKSNATYYEPSNRLREYWKTGGNSTNKARPDAAQQTHKLDEKTHNLNAETHKLPTLKHKLGLLPSEIVSRINSLGSRVKKDERETLVLDLCRNFPWTAAELAEVTKIKDPLYLQREYLKPLILAGKINYLHPDFPNHPKQAYKAVQA